MENNLRTLGRSEAKVVLSFREQGREILRATDIIELLGSEQTGRKVIHNLIRKGWLSRLGGGRYMLLPPERGEENIGENNALALAAAAVEPSYVGWWPAASFHGFTTQKPTIVTVAVLRQVKPRIIEGNEVRFVKVAKRKFFGFQSYNVYDRRVQISSPEKTLVDCLDRADLAGGPAELARIVFSAMTESDMSTLANTAMEMESTSLLQRLGFLTDIVGKPLSEDTRRHVRDSIPKSARATFGRSERKKDDIGYVADWGLFVNARCQDLMADVPHISNRKGS